MIRHSKISTRGIALNKAAFHHSHCEVLGRLALHYPPSLITSGLPIVPPLITLLPIALPLTPFPHPFHASASKQLLLTQLQQAGMDRYLGVRVNRQNDRPRIHPLCLSLPGGRVPLVRSGHSPGPSRRTRMFQLRSGRTTIILTWIHGQIRRGLVVKSAPSLGKLYYLFANPKTNYTTQG